jgi:hypothetical protein
MCSTLLFKRWIVLTSRIIQTSQQLNYNCGLSDCLQQYRVHEISVQIELKWRANLLQKLSSTMTGTTATTDCTLETCCVGKRSILANRQCVSPVTTLCFHHYLVGGMVCSSLLISNSLIHWAFFPPLSLPFIPLWVPTWTNPKFSVSCCSR